MRVSEREERETGVKMYLMKLMLEVFLKLKKETDFQVQKS